MKWLIGIAIVMVILHFFWRRTEKRGRRGRLDHKEDDPPKD
jgi:hypothetical protein